jgi:hypothetical protein
MKAILEFNLPEDQTEYQILCHHSMITLHGKPLLLRKL